MQHPRNILLDYDLFVDLYVYACRHSEQDDLQFKRLCAGVRKKLETMMRHGWLSFLMQCDDLPALIMAIVTTLLLRLHFLPHLL